MDIQQKKRQLREDIYHRLKNLSEKERAAESRSLCRRILELLPATSLSFAAFSSLRSEPALFPLLQELLKRGERLYLPRVENGKIVFRRVEDLRTLKPGSFNILEPRRDAELLDPSTLHTALIPGVAFDRTGNRLGRGNGGYDIWIAAQRKANPQTKFYGICFEAQLVQQVPVEPHDQKVDTIVTARGLQ